MFAHVEFHVEFCSRFKQNVFSSLYVSHDDVLEDWQLQGILAIMEFFCVD